MRVHHIVYTYARNLACSCPGRAGTRQGVCAREREGGGGGGGGERHPTYKHKIFRSSFSVRAVRAGGGVCPLRTRTSLCGGSRGSRGRAGRRETEQPEGGEGGLALVGRRRPRRSEGKEQDAGQGGRTDASVRFGCRPSGHSFHAIKEPTVIYKYTARYSNTS